MEKEEVDKVVEEMLNTTREFLSYAMKKSGIRGDLKALGSKVSFVMNDNKMKSFFMGEYITPNEVNPSGEIRLYIDAIISYAEYLGVDYWSTITKVLFCQVHHALTWESKNKFDFDKAEKFASKICKKLVKQKIITDLRPKMYINTSDRLVLTARQKWIEKWLGMGFEEAMQMLHESENPETVPMDTVDENNTGT